MATKEVSATSEAEQVEVAEVAEDTPKSIVASGIVKNYILGTVAAGFIPVPLADIAVIAGVQLKMLHSLANLYEVKFTKDLGKSAIASLTGGIAATGVGAGVLVSLAKGIPIVGPALGAAAMPAVAGASTYAVGQVFIQHFESGGTFLDFDPDKVKAYFAEQFDKGKLAVADLRK
ncbi:MAG: YcjF family protein [Candidatus Latescibacterota bacterium]|jgi:uncharacterized protein (DUF697 family)